MSSCENDGRAFLNSASKITGHLVLRDALIDAQVQGNCGTGATDNRRQDQLSARIQVPSLIIFRKN